MLNKFQDFRFLSLNFNVCKNKIRFTLLTVSLNTRNLTENNLYAKQHIGYISLAELI